MKSHYLTCNDDNCEEDACVDRRMFQAEIKKLRTCRACNLVNTSSLNCDECIVKQLRAEKALLYTRLESMRARADLVYKKGFDIMPTTYILGVRDTLDFILDGKLVVNERLGDMEKILEK